jgi:hypothetical protein
MDADLEKQEVQAIIDYYKTREKTAVQNRDYQLADEAKKKIEEFRLMEIQFPSITYSDLKWGEKSND